MIQLPDGALKHNRDLAAGTVITEIRLHPFINKSGKWDFTPEILHFEILEVFYSSYQCRYTDTDDNQEFNWPFWDIQPHYGFWIDQCSPVWYYAGAVDVSGIVSNS